MLLTAPISPTPRSRSSFASLLSLIVPFRSAFRRGLRLSRGFILYNGIHRGIGLGISQNLGFVKY